MPGQIVGKGGQGIGGRLEAGREEQNTLSVDHVRRQGFFQMIKNLLQTINEITDFDFCPPEVSFTDNVHFQVVNL